MLIRLATRRRLLIWPIMLFIAILGLVGVPSLGLAQESHGTFRAVIAAPTKYRGELTEEDGLSGAAPRMLRALSTFAERAGYPVERRSIKIFLDRQVRGLNADGDATDTAIVEAIYEAARSSRSNDDMLVIFFTGHGAVDPRSGGAVLFTTGATGSPLTRRILLQDQVLSPIAAESRARANIVFVDACRTLRPGALATAGSILDVGAIDRYRTQGTAIFFGSRETKPAYVHPQLRYGIFTEHLARALESEDFQTAEQLSGHLDTTVSADTPRIMADASKEQRPTLSVLNNVGGFYILPSRPSATPPVVAVPTTPPTPQPRWPSSTILDPGRVSLALDVQFDHLSKTLSQSARRQLDDLIEKLKGMALEVIVGIGHSASNETSGGVSAQQISEQRGDVIKWYLVTKGVEINRIYTEGKGSKQPIASNSSPEGRAANRRVEIEVVARRLVQTGR